MKQVKAGQVTLALCWAHQRRDFIEVERGRPELNGWASAWLARIGTLYRLNAARLAVWQQEPLAFAAADQERWRRWHRRVRRSRHRRLCPWRAARSWRA
jgi:transposase